MSQAPSPSKPRTGGQILVGQLVSHGVKHVFCVPGESFLAVLDALVDVKIDVTVCRQEGGAAMMADAHGKLTGQPGICMVTRGPGAANALAGIHIAKQDSSPLIVFVGQIERGMREREAFQEMDYRAIFGQAAKWATEIDDAARIPEILSRACHVATSGRPGPVVIALPEDMLVEMATVQDAPHYEAIDSAPAAGQMADLSKRLAAAKAPVAILGGTRWDASAVKEFASFAEKFKLPVAVSFRRQMLFPADHPCFIGDVGIGLNPALLKRIENADLVLLVGGRMSEMPSQAYTLFDIPVPKQTLVHVHPDSAELGRVYRASLAINASPSAFVSELAALPAPADHALAMGGATVVSLPEAGREKVDLPAVLRDLAQRGVNELHVEAGHKLNGSFLRAGLVDELLLYLAPKLMGPGAGLAALGPFTAMDQALPWAYTDVAPVGPDLRLRLRRA